MIQKEGAKGFEARNYLPIFCLPMMCKLMTGIYHGDQLYHNLDRNGLLADEQRRCRKGCQETKDQLIVDKLGTLEEMPGKVDNLSMAWVDFEEAYYMVPLSWMLQYLEIIEAAKNNYDLYTKQHCGELEDSDSSIAKVESWIQTGKGCKAN